jgi:phosphoglycerol transferase
MLGIKPSLFREFKKVVLENFSIADLVLVCSLVLSLTFCTKSPGIIKPESKYSSTLSEGIVFSREGNPQFIKRITGLAGREPWGRWSDQDEVLIEFAELLPPKNYIFRLEAKGFGSNIGANTQVIIGSNVINIVLQSNPEKFTLPVDVKAPLSQIKIVPAAPSSPNSLDSNNPDVRRLGIGLITLSIL